MASLGPFRLDRPLGRGGMAEVWRAVHAAQGVPVAIKLLHGNAGEAERAAFRNEVRAVARLDHPAIILVYDHGVAGAGLPGVEPGTPWLAMELCTGGTLASAAPGDWAGARAVLRSVLGALALAHARGVVHRDLKPDNVLLAGPHDARPGWKLSDFGLAFAREARGAVLGTPGYMAPEQFRRAWREYGPWTDLYGLGALAWELVSGEPPFGRARSAEALALAHAEAPPPRLVPRFEVPAALEGWMRLLLEKEPDRRPQAAADALAGLDALGDRRRPPRAVLPDDDGAPALPPARRIVGAGLGLFAWRPVPLVDREEERRRLWTALLRVAREDSARAVVVHGELGIGKSRLVDHVVERAHELGGVTVLRARHGPLEGGDDGIVPPLAQVLGATRLDRPATLARCAAWLKRRGVTDPWEWNALASLLLPAADASGVVQLATPAQRHAVARRVLERLAAERPVVLVVDDAQWGADAVELVAALLDAQSASPAPILAILVTRTEGPPVPGSPVSAALALGDHPLAERLALRPLGGPHLVQLVEGQLGLGGPLAAQVRERAGGNPGFVVRLVAEWVERGALVWGSDGFALAPGVAVRLPDGLIAVGRERVERVATGYAALADDVRRALEIAAVLGPELAADEWDAAAAMEALTVPPSLPERLVEAGILEPAPAGGWSFVDRLAREALERGAADAGRLPAAHLACALALARLPDRDDLAERVGRHLHAAGRPAEAAEPLLRAAAERAARGEDASALALLAEREAGLRAALVPPEEVRWGEGRVLQARILARQGRWEEALPPAEAALANARRHGQAAVLPAALAVRGEIARGRGEPAVAIELLREARSGFEAARDDQGQAQVLSTLGLLHRQLGDLAAAGRLYQQAQLLHLKRGDAVGVADCLVARADVARRTRRAEAALELLAQAEAAYARRKSRLGEAEVLLVRGDIARSRGDLATAVSCYRTSLELREDVGSGEVLAPLAGLGLALDVMERAVDARQVLALALDLAGRRGSASWLGVLHGLLLPVEALTGDTAALDHHLAEARRWLTATGEVTVDVAEAAERAARRIELRDPARARALFHLAREQLSNSTLQR